MLLHASRARSSVKNNCEPSVISSVVVATDESKSLRSRMEIDAIASDIADAT